MQLICAFPDTPLPPYNRLLLDHQRYDLVDMVEGQLTRWPLNAPCSGSSSILGTCVSNGK